VAQVRVQFATCALGTIDGGRARAIREGSSSSAQVACLMARVPAPR
jgi:hypothetical protein